MGSSAVGAPACDLLTIRCGVLGGEFLAFEASFWLLFELSCLEAAAFYD